MLEFKHIKLKNFGPYHEADIDLKDKGFCIIRGENHCLTDNAKSNGCGKCFGRDTEVLMYDGSVKKVQDIVVGDKLMGPNSEAKTVIETHSGEDDLYRVSSTKTDNYSYICNGSHEIILFHTGGLKEKEVKDKILVSVEDYFNNNISYNIWRYYNQCHTKGVEFSSKIQLPLEPYILGLWLGDGSEGAPDITVGNKDIEIKSYIENFAKDHSLKIRYQGKVNKDGSITNSEILCLSRGCEKGVNFFIDTLRNIGVLRDKKIPDIYLKASRTDRLQLLAGLLDTAGYLSLRKKSNGKIAGARFEIVQKRELLAKQIVFLARMLGFKATINKKISWPVIDGIRGKKDTYWRIYIYGNLWDIPVKLPRRKCPIYKVQSCYTLRPHITKVGYGKYYGFEVDGDHEFLLADGTIVHNSTLPNSLCFALTGETISGITKNLANNNPDSDEAYVELNVSYEGNDYLIKRILKPKSDLRIVKNGTDISGKGIKESAAVLVKELPDIDYNLISSTIILGQSMPAKLSSFNPSGRKELLEKLTKSDFMIEDMKSRVSKRLDELNRSLRAQEDSSLVNKSKLIELTNRLAQLKNERENAVAPDYDKYILMAKANLAEAQKDIENNTKLLSSTKAKLDEENKKYLALMQEKSKVEHDELAAYNTCVDSIITDKANVSAEIKALEKEIFQLKNIRDVCPTCGQKIPGVHKHNTSKQETQVKDLQAKLKTLTEDFNDKNKKHTEYVKQINESFKKDIDAANKLVSELNADQASYNRNITEAYSKQSQFMTEVNKWTYEKANADKQWKKLLSDIDEAEKQIIVLQSTVKLSENMQVDLNSRLEIVKKMDTLIKRDFRGYLLTNIIDYLNKKAKEYCNIVFGNDRVNLELNGNNLDITYDNKMFDNLSGGEKQRVDIMLQFAIRDLMNKYFSVNSNIIVLDEITDYLDNQSCQAVIKLITEKLNDIESVFIISHHMDELGIPVDSQIHIVKDETGISSIQ